MLNLKKTNNEFYSLNVGDTVKVIGGDLFCGEIGTVREVKPNGIVYIKIYGKTGLLSYKNNELANFDKLNEVSDILNQ